MRTYIYGPFQFSIFHGIWDISNIHALTTKKLAATSKLIVEFIVYIA